MSGTEKKAMYIGKPRPEGKEQSQVTDIKHTSCASD
jgi:hypothetical protein